MVQSTTSQEFDYELKGDKEYAQILININSLEYYYVKLIRDKFKKSHIYQPVEGYYWLILAKLRKPLKNTDLIFNSTK